MHKLSNIQITKWINQIHVYQFLLAAMVVAIIAVNARAYHDGYEQGKLDSAKWFYILTKGMAAKTSNCDTLVQLQFSDTIIFDIRNKKCCE